jgi:hypothetical protein
MTADYSTAVMSTKSREIIWGGRMGAEIRAQGAREAGPIGKLIEQRPKPGQSACRAAEGLPSHLLLSANVSTAGWPGSRWNATDARRGRASRWTPSAGRGIHQFGSMKPR